MEGLRERRLYTVARKVKEEEGERSLEMRRGFIDMHCVRPCRGPPVLSHWQTHRLNAFIPDARAI